MSVTRSQLILGIALLIVSGTLAFAITFNFQEKKKPTTSQDPESTTPLATTKRDQDADLGRTKFQDRQNYYDTHHEISVSRDEDREAASIVEQESRDRLDQLTNRYNLTPLQQREIFPIIAAFHPQFRDGMLINGQSAPLFEEQDPESPSIHAFENAIHPFLDTFQQEQIQEDVLSVDRWWGEISHQLQDDLRQAIERGEMIPEVVKPIQDEELTEEELTDDKNDEIQSSESLN